MQAFQRLPPEVCLKLARNCQPVQLPPSAVLFEEDAAADAMYVVLSGRCHVRAQPLQPATAACPDDGQCFAGPCAVSEGRCGEVVAKLDEGEAAVGMVERVARRGSNWESGAFTEEEQDRLQAIQAALKADDMQVITTAGV